MAKFLARWEWSPKTDTVSYEGKDKEGKPVKVTYQRSQLSSQSDAVKNEIDPNFANDQYWLILPFHIVWDGVTVTDEGMHKLPLGDASAATGRREIPFGRRLPARRHLGPLRWRRQANPGDRLPSGRAQAAAQSRDRDYTDYKKAGPLVVAMDHHGTMDGKAFRLSFRMCRSS